MFGSDFDLLPSASDDDSLEAYTLAQSVSHHPDKKEYINNSH